MHGTSKMYQRWVGNAGAADEITQCRTSKVRTDTKSWRTISSINLYTAGTTKALAQRQNKWMKPVSRSDESSVHLPRSLMQRLGQLQVSTPPVYPNCQPGGMVRDHTVLGAHERAKWWGHVLRCLPAVFDGVDHRRCFQLTDALASWEWYVSLVFVRFWRQWQQLEHEFGKRHKLDHEQNGFAPKPHTPGLEVDCSISPLASLYVLDTFFKLINHWSLERAMSCITNDQWRMTTFAEWRKLIKSLLAKLNWA